MTLSDQLKVIFGLISVNLLLGAESVKVYLDKYGHCIHDDFELDGDTYTVLPKGGGMQHESLYCDVTFKAQTGNGICLNFEKFHIGDCRVKLKLFDKSSASGKPWRTLQCDDPSPPRMCTGNRYVTIALSKLNLQRNKNYNFLIQIKENVDGELGDIPVEPSIGETYSDEDVFFASIGIFVAIIVGVIILIITIAVIIICCCCKIRRQSGTRYQATSTSPPTQAQPSAPPPPAPTAYFASQTGVPPIYPPLPSYHSEAPPPYTPHSAQLGYAPQSMYTGDPENKQPMV